MMEIAKEEQIQAIYDLKVGYTLGHADIAMLKAMARQLLAGLDQEPVYQACKEAGVWVDIEPDDVDSLKANGEQIRVLYAAPQLPQPAVETTHSSVIAEQLAHVLSGVDVTDHQRAVINCAVDRLNKNAAMLQGDEPKKDMRKEFERWMIEDQKCIIGSADIYAQHLEQRNWSAWKTIWSVFFSKE